MYTVALALAVIAIAFVYLGLNLIVNHRIDRHRDSDTLERIAEWVFWVLNTVAVVLLASTLYLMLTK